MRKGRWLIKCSFSIVCLVNFLVPRYLILIFLSLALNKILDIFCFKFIIYLNGIPMKRIR